MKLRLPAVAALACLAGALASAGAEPTFAVRYRSSSTVYLEGGRAQGLAAGDRLVVRGPAAAAAELEVLFVADQSASCRVVSEARAVVPGDVAVLVPRATAPPARAPAGVRPAAAPAVAAAPTPAAAVPGPLARFRGGLSLGYYRVQDSAGLVGSQQQTANADFRAWDIGGLPLSLGARLRLRRDQRLSAPTDAVQRDDRVYELSLHYQPASGAFDLEAGRIGASTWASVGTLDGVVGQVRLASPFHLGGFYGRRADLARPGAPSAGTRYGAFLRLTPAAPTGRGYDVLLGGVRELQDSEPSREYLSLESRFNGGARWSLYERAELDVNRGWRRALTGRAYQLSNVWVSATARIADAHSLVLSYDSRRSYRDLGNRTIPEQIFDDALRQGFRAGLYLGPPRGFNLALNAGGRLGERGNGRSWSYGGALRHGNLRGFSVSVDGSAFQSPTSEGWLATAQAARSFGRGHYLDASYGASRYRTAVDGVSRATEWVRGSARVQLVGGLYVMLDAEYGMGDDFRGPRVFVETGFRF